MEMKVKRMNKCGYRYYYIEKEDGTAIMQENSTQKMRFTTIKAAMNYIQSLRQEAFAN